MSNYSTPLDQHLLVSPTLPPLATTVLLPISTSLAVLDSTFK